MDRICFMRWMPFLVAVLVFPAGAFAAFLVTPVLWKLETMLGLELAGHSGPADWVLGMFGAVASVLAGLGARALRGNRR